jgi:hypothetical protein
MITEAEKQKLRDTLATKCGECGAYPCDCVGPAGHWGYWMLDRTGPGWVGCASRASAIEHRENRMRQDPNSDRGPVQRLSEPNPFETKAERWGVWCVGPSTMGQWIESRTSNKKAFDSRTEAEALLVYCEQFAGVHTHEVRPYTEAAAVPVTRTVFQHVADTTTPLKPDPPVLVGITIEALPRILFESDPAIRSLRIDDRVSDNPGPYRVDVVARAWERDHAGLRTKYTEMVQRVVERVGKSEAGK